MRYEILADDVCPGRWLVRAVEGVDEAGRPTPLFEAIFGGPEAERRAREYAAWLEGRRAEPPASESGS